MSEDDPIPKKSVPSWMKGLLASVIILTLLMGYLLTGRPSPETRVEAHLKAMQEQNVTAAYYDFFEKPLQDRMNLESFRQLVKDLASSKVLQNREIIVHVLPEDRNVAEITVKERKTKKAILIYTLDFEKSGWKVRDIKDVRNIPEIEEYTPVKKDAIQEVPTTLEVENLLPTLYGIIDDTFSLIKEDEVEDIYKKYTSEIFQSVTTLDQFQHFVHSYPFLNGFTEITRDGGEEKEGLIDVKVTLEFENKSFPIHFLFKNEKEVWKIQSFKVTLPHDYKMGEINQKDQILFPVANQLKVLKKGEREDSYNTYTSKEFKENTSFESFDKFLNEAPFLSTYETIDFKQRLQEGDKGYILIDLYYKDQDNGIKVKEVEYELLFEDGMWKIRGMRVVQSGEKILKQKVLEETAKPLSFTNILVAAKTNPQGIIEDEENKLSPGDNNIYVNVYLKDGKPGDNIELGFSHLESGSKIEPVRTIIQERGDAIASFIYSAPTLGWPKGEYELEITGPEGVNMKKQFQVE